MMFVVDKDERQKQKEEDAELKKRPDGDDIVHWNRVIVRGNEQKSA